ncbi:hypothetical protein [Brytella acorum]|uniref:Uncharacterized protein n=1 Tax=Brytella acorum TaxID=2959299 RepID=A0AA35UGY6_9PROT|nr:hypothetical protein [Brytella acorum]MDF3623753.1 hypothetical protein [Brytella acorum]CAI9119829.1 hypothetical protein LMG32879_000655 [Brytella acorum]
MINFIFDDFSKKVTIPDKVFFSKIDNQEPVEIKISTVDQDLVYEKGLMEGRVQGESHERLKVASDKRRAYFSLQKSVNCVLEENNKEKILNRKILEKIMRAFLLKFSCDLDEKIIKSTVNEVIEKYIEGTSCSERDKITISGDFSGKKFAEWNEKKNCIWIDASSKNKLLNISNESGKISLKLNRL